MTPHAAAGKGTPRSARRARLPATLLDAFFSRNGITTTALAAASFISRRHTGQIRAGRVIGVTIVTAKQLAKGASRILRRKVAVAELFDLDYFCRWPR